MANTGGLDVVSALIGLQQARSVEFLHFTVNFLKNLSYEDEF